MHANRIGIALAAYRPDPEAFRQQLESIRAQTHPNWICAVTLDSPIVDLRSDAGLAPFFEDRRFVWSENPVRLGHKKNFEKAIQTALGLGVGAIACADQDDVWYPEKLARLVDALTRAGPLALVHSDMHIMNPDGSIQPETAWTIEHRGIHNHRLRHFLVRNVVGGAAMLMDAELARRFPVIPDGAEYHDHWYAVVASTLGGIHAIHEPLFAYRQHQSNVVGVTPFKSTFALPAESTLHSIATKCRAGWKKSLVLARSVAEAGIPLGPIERVVFLSGWDLGIGVALLGLFHVADDRPLTRACLARGIGKALDTMLGKCGWLAASLLLLAAAVVGNNSGGLSTLLYSFETSPVEWTMININHGNLQGDAHLLRFPDGTNMLVDCGDPNQTLVPELEKRGIRTIDKILISHPHVDHYGGLMQLTKQTRIRVRQVHMNFPDKTACDVEKGWGCHYEDLMKTREALLLAGIELLPMSADQDYYSKGDIRLSGLYSFTPQNMPFKSNSINEMSAVLLLTKGSIRVLFTGDMGGDFGRYLAEFGRNLGADIVKVPHHGADGLAPNEFFDRVQAKAALVPGPRWLWDSERALRIREYLNRKRIPTYVNGYHGHVQVLLGKWGYQIVPEVSDRAPFFGMM